MQTATTFGTRFTLDVMGGAAWFVERVTGVSVHPPHASPRPSISTSYELMTEESDTLTVTCPPGLVWQWTLEVSRCGQAPTAVGTRNARCTPNVEQPPCCVPGFEADPRRPFDGGCVKTHDGVGTQLKSPPCEQVRDSGVPLDFRVQQERYLKHLAEPSAAAPAVGAGMLLGAAAASLLLFAARLSPARAALL